MGVVSTTGLTIITLEVLGSQLPLDDESDERERKDEEERRGWRVEEVEEEEEGSRNLLERLSLVEPELIDRSRGKSWVELDWSESTELVFGGRGYCKCVPRE